MEYFFDQCKVRPAKKQHILIAAHYCVSLSVRLLIALNILSWLGWHPGSVFNVDTPIADVANSKRHQQLEEILIIFTCTIQEEISKVVCKETISETCIFITSLCCMKRTHYSKRMLCKQDCIKFRRRIARQSFFENNFADFSDVVRVKKKSRFRPAVGGISN